MHKETIIKSITYLMNGTIRLRSNRRAASTAQRSPGHSVGAGACPPHGPPGVSGQRSPT